MSTANPRHKLRSTLFKTLLTFICLVTLIADLPLLFGGVAQFTEQPFGVSLAAGNISVYSIIRGVLLVAIGITLINLLNNLFNLWLKQFNSGQEVRHTMASRIGRLLIIITLTLVILAALGVDLTLLAVFGSASALGIGFGLQKITSNLISGLILRFDRSFSTGDLVELTDSTMGTVKRIDLRYTLISTFDGREILIPNEQFITERVVNWTYSDNLARISVPVGVAYGSNLQLVQQLMKDAAREHPRCMADPAPDCMIREFGDSAIMLLLWFWVNDITQGRFGPQSEVMESIARKFAEHGIEIPFPQRSVSLNSPLQIQQADSNRK